MNKFGNCVVCDTAIGTRGKRFDDIPVTFAGTMTRQGNTCGNPSCVVAGMRVVQENGEEAVTSFATTLGTCVHCGMQGTTVYVATRRCVYTTACEADVARLA